jgi:RNA 2',3'-cyclic 3'-phosphodiesterase
LLFLGKLECDRIPEVEEAMRRTALEHWPLVLRFKELGVFPHWNDPRVLWLGVKDKTRQLKTLQSALARRLGPLAFRPDGQEFHPHVTLARFKSLKGVGPARKIIESHGRFEVGPFVSNTLTLYRSELCVDGALHIPLASTALSPMEPAPDSAE